MPTPGKGTKFFKLILSQVSKDMREPLVPMAIPALASHLKEVEVMYCDNKYHELCGQMGHLIGPSGIGKQQLSYLIEAICRSFRKHDETEFAKLVDWQRQMKTKGANKEKPERPEVCFWFPPADVTNAAFIQNAMACEKLGARSQYLNLPEVEMADRMCGGHKQVSQMIRNIYDRQRAGALRATADGVTGNPILRVNITFSSTPYSARKFYKTELYVGTFGRISFSYKARQERNGVIPLQGKYSEKFMRKLDEFSARLDICKGKFVIAKLNKLADKLAADMATIADLADDDVIWDMSKRSIVNAWKNGCIMYILNGQVWTKAMSDMVEWMVYHDLWSKLQVFGDMFKNEECNISETQKCGPKNMLDDLPNEFNETQLEALRVSLGKSKDGKALLYVWKNRGFITYSNQTGLYTKTEKYLKR
jgi:hypothetical protein